MFRVTDYIANYIYRLGVKEIFMGSGGGMMFLCDGIAQHPHLKPICLHHEQAVAMAAVSYAKYKEHLGVAYVTTGCGGTNTITGLLGAWQDNIPCLFVSGQSKRKETVRNSRLKLRQFGVQEADIIPIVSSLTKYAVMINDVQEIAYHLDKAVFLARTGRPGPVWLDIPLDVQGAIVNEEGLRQFDPAQEPKEYKEEPTQEEIAIVEEAIRTAERPVIIAGQGIRLGKAITQLRTFIEKNQIPMVAPRLGVDLIPTDHPLFVGRIGNKGDRPGNFAVQNADLVLSIGSRLSVSSTGHEYHTFAREARIIVVDIDPIEHQKNTIRIDYFINADAKRFLERISKDLRPKTEKWVKRCQEWKFKYPICLPHYSKEKGGINFYYFMDRLSAHLKPDSVVIGDAGSAVYVPPQSIKIREGQRYITSGGQAEMGYTIPASIGVSVARNKGEVIGITGDGSFQLNIQELQSIVHHDLPIKLFVWNNDGYLSIRATQAKFFNGRFIGTDKSCGISFPNLKKIAGAYGIKYFKLADSRRLNRGIQQVLAYPKAAICEVMCIRDQEVIPTVASQRKEDGTMVSKPLEDMYPFLEREEFLSNMIIKPLEE